jgi:hypothetical protein
MSNRLAILVVTVFLAVNCAAQRPASQNGLAPDPLRAATKPLTPKSPITMGKSWATPPPAANPRRTNEELTNLERQTLSTPTPASAPNRSRSRASARTAPTKPFGPTPSSGSGINASYQKPNIPRK